MLLQADGVLVRSRLGFDNYLVVDYIGKGDGLLLLWQNEIDVTVCSFTKGHVDTLIKDDEGSSWRFTGFYGDPIQSCRRLSWDLLRRLGSMGNLPWLVVEDFNEVLHLGKKLGVGDPCFRMLWFVIRSIGVLITEWAWNKKQRESLREFNSLREELRGLYDGGRSIFLGQKIAKLEDKIDGLLLKDEVFWRQRTRTMWLKAGDKNKKLFSLKSLPKKET
ncbi:hypothetical protein ACOSP7_017057 [Xanthoceras sorbifolium]